MMKKTYIAPSIAEYCFGTTEMICQSGVVKYLDQSQNQQNITPTEEEFGGEFQSRKSLWDDEEEF